MTPPEPTPLETTPLEILLVVQEHDLTADRLRHRRASLPERAELAALEAKLGDVAGVLDDLGVRRAEVDTRERRLADEVAAVTTRAAEVERSMYSGEVSSPRELQAMQADVEQLRRHQRTLEDKELELMEGREQLDIEIATVGAGGVAAGTEADHLRARIAEQEAEIDAALEQELDARGALAAGLGDDLVAIYEDRRAKASGGGTARLVGMTCQGCHLTIPSTEVDRMRRAAHAADTAAELSFCDNCGCILVLV